MAILGFNFTKINTERFPNKGGKIKISSNLTLTSVKETKLVASDTQKSFQFDFQFSIKYDDEIGVIDLSGHLLYLADEVLAKKIAEGWDKKQSLPQEVMVPVFNHILQKCNVEALILSKEMNLPSPIPLPKVNPQKAEAQKAEKSIPKK